MALLPERMALPRQLRALLAVVVVLSLPKPDGWPILSESLLDASWTSFERISQMFPEWVGLYYTLVDLAGQCFLLGFPIYLLSFMLFPERTQHSRRETWTTVFTLCGALLGIVLAAPLTLRVFGDAYDPYVEDGPVAVPLLCLVFHWTLGYLVGSKLDALVWHRRSGSTEPIPKPFALLPESVALPRQLRALLVVVLVLLMPNPMERFVLTEHFRAAKLADSLVASSYHLEHALRRLPGELTFLAEADALFEALRHLAELVGNCLVLGAAIYVASFLLLRASPARSDLWATTCTGTGAFFGLLVLGPLETFLFRDGTTTDYGVRLSVLLLCFALLWSLGYLVGAKLDRLVANRRHDNPKAGP